MTNRVFLLGGLRTHIGIRNGIFKNVLPEKLGAALVKEIKRKYFVENPDFLICGNAIGPGGNIGRLTLLNAGISDNVPAFTVDTQCASGLTAIDIAYSKIASGQCELVFAGGIESTSLQPYREYNENDPRTKLRNSKFTAAQFSPSEYEDDAMLSGAEKTAKLLNISKKEADMAALECYQNAYKARDKNLLGNIICPLFSSKRDEVMRRKFNEKLLERAPLIFNQNGSVLTSANSCTINDGAAFVILASENWMKQNKRECKIELLSTMIKGTNPEYPPLAADFATLNILNECNLKYKDIFAFEYNESFSIIRVHFQKEHNEEKKRFNKWGGALAYGHPYGASGAILMLHLQEILKKENGQYGIAAIPAAGGIGQAILVVNHKGKK